MHELTITPQGHLLVRETSLEPPDRKLTKALLEAYRESPARGMLHSASEELDALLPPSFEFARSIAQLYLTNLCKTATGQPGEPIPEVPPPSTDLERAILQAPPMSGLEYLTTDAISTWWQELDTLTRGEVEKHPEGAQGYLRERNPHWRFVGRVTLHLAENKRDPQYPFAFLATFANGLTPQGKVKHEHLGRALQQYAGKQNRTEMLNLLLPVSKAAESSELIRRLVDTGEIYQPLAWSARQAYDFLQAIPLLESSGVIVRVPDWWNAQKPARPRVSVKINSKNSASIGVDAMLQFSVNMSLEGETLSQEEIDQLLQTSGGLIQLKGKWVEVDREKLQNALDHWKKVENEVRHSGLSFFEGMRLLSGANLVEEEEDKSKAAIRQWSGLTAGAELEAVLKALRSPEQENAPPGLKADLRPYQQTGYAWLRFVVRLGLGACLADDMGLGKTVQVISLLLDLKRDKKQNASLLVVPASLIANWKSELAKFAPSLSFGVAHPSETNANTAEFGRGDVDKFDLIVTTYGMLVRSG
jgi:SNF2 Helicase protein/SNF2-related domain